MSAILIWRIICCKPCSFCHLNILIQSIIYGVGSNLDVAILVCLIHYFICLVFFIVFFPFSCFPLFSLWDFTASWDFCDNVLLVIIYAWITIMGYYKYELCTINMLYSLKKFWFILHPYRATPSAPKVAVVERFDCSIFQRQKTWHCILTFLWLYSLNPAYVSF